MKRGCVLFALAGILLLCTTGCKQTTPQSETPTPSVGTAEIDGAQESMQSEEFNLQTLVDTFHEANIEEVITQTNNNIVTQLGLILDSETELASIRFVDMFFADGKDIHYDYYDLVVRYSMTFDDEENDALYIKSYRPTDDVKRYLEWNFGDYKQLPSVLEYLYEHSEDMKDNGYTIALNQSENTIAEYTSNLHRFDASLLAWIIEQDSEQ